MLAMQHGGHTWIGQGVSCHCCSGQSHSADGPAGCIYMCPSLRLVLCTSAHGPLTDSSGCSFAVSDSKAQGRGGWLPSRPLSAYMFSCETCKAAIAAGRQTQHSMMQTTSLNTCPSLVRYNSNALWFQWFGAAHSYLHSLLHNLLVAARSTPLGRLSL